MRNKDLSYEELTQSVAEARAKVLDNPLNGNVKVLDMHTDLMFGLVLLAEYHSNNEWKEWEIKGLADQMMLIAEPMEQYDVCLNDICSAVSRMTDVITQHPRLKLRLLRFERQVLQRIECMQGHELSLTESVEEEILVLETNIRHADNNEFDKIGDSSNYLKTDPVEWTEKWEEVIDEAERMTAEELKDENFFMGFCHMYWSAKKKNLYQLGVRWRPLSEMNPGALFD